MNIHPIIFSAPMVRAIISGRKTQTRRKVHPRISELLKADRDSNIPPASDFLAQHSPYGLPGDSLWVKETWRTPKNLDLVKPSELPDRTPISYRADMEQQDSDDWGKWRTSLFMPRWASRIQLEIMEVRLERLNTCSNEDAIAEGLSKASVETSQARELKWGFEGEALRQHISPVAAYAEMWKTINGEGSWAKNPWVWVLSFRRIDSQ